MPKPLFMDECGENPFPSTKIAVLVDEEAGLSTIRAVYVDKWQKNRHPSTYKHDYVDGETGSSMKTALYVDDYGPKAGLVFLKEVDTANVTTSLYFQWSTLLRTHWPENPDRKGIHRPTLTIAPLQLHT